MFDLDEWIDDDDGNRQFGEISRFWISVLCVKYQGREKRDRGREIERSTL